MLEVTEPEAVNASTHLGIWKCHYDENGNQKSVHYTEEFRRMPGFSKQELPDTIKKQKETVHPGERMNRFFI